MSVLSALFQKKPIADVDPESEAKSGLTRSLGAMDLIFLAIGAVLGMVLFWAGGDGAPADVAGRALALFSLGSMLAASLVLVTSGRRYLRPALVQGTLPLIGFVLFFFA